MGLTKGSSKTKKNHPNAEVKHKVEIILKIYNISLLSFSKCCVGDRTYKILECRNNSDLIFYLHIVILMNS